MEKREEKTKQNTSEQYRSEGQAPIDNITGSDFPMNYSTTQNRYSDEDLQEFKIIVLNKLAEARSDYELLKGTLTRSDENGTNDTTPGFKPAEDAVEGFSKEEITQLAFRQQKFIEHLQNALTRIENKTYGICRITGKLIAKERLKSVPHTTMCIDAKLEMSRLN